MGQAWTVRSHQPIVKHLQGVVGPVLLEVGNDEQCGDGAEMRWRAQEASQKGGGEGDVGLGREGVNEDGEGEGVERGREWRGGAWRR